MIWKEGKKIYLSNLIIISFIMDMVNYYEGSFANDETSDIGRLIHSFGDYGNMIKLMDMINITNTEIKQTYEGNWVNDQQQGQGLETWQDGSSYEGEYFNGKQQGREIVKWEIGNMYIGDFKNNKIDGRVVYYCQSRKVYDSEWEGEWKQEKQHERKFEEWIKLKKSLMKGLIVKSLLKNKLNKKLWFVILFYIYKIILIQEILQFLDSQLFHLNNEIIFLIILLLYPFLRYFINKRVQLQPKNIINKSADVKVRFL